LVASLEEEAGFFASLTPALPRNSTCSGWIRRWARVSLCMHSPRGVSCTGHSIVYKLGVSLPDAPLDALTKATAHRIQLEHGIFASVAGERVVCVE